MRKGLVLPVVVACLLASCKEGKMQNVFSQDEEAEEDSLEAFMGDTLHLFEEDAPPVSVDELFVDFFYSFADDARFQNQRISFPLSCKDGNEEMKLTRDDWMAYNRFTTQNIYSVIYEREHDLDLQKDTTVSSVGVEWIYLQEDYVEKFNFNRINGKWTLTDIEKELCSNLPNSNFLEFYAHFVSDSTFQRSSLATPVKLVLTSDEDENEATEEYLSADDWFNMRHDLPLSSESLVNIDYGQACISQNRKTLLMEGVSNGLQMKLKFDKRSDGWKLIEIEY